MKKLLFIFSVFISCCSVALAEPTKYILKVIDSVTKEPIVGASILNLDYIDKGCTTDINGTIALCTKTELPTGHIKISYVGYMPQEVTLVAETETIVELEEEVASLGVEGFAVASSDCQQYFIEHKQEIMDSIESGETTYLRFKHVVSLKPGSMGTVPSGSGESAFVKNCVINECDPGFTPWNRRCVEKIDRVQQQTVINVVNRDPVEVPVVIDPDNEDDDNDNQNFENAISNIDKWISGLDLNRNKWKDVSGNFNTARLASDLTAGIVLGTVGGVVSGVVIKKKQVEKGFEALYCAVGGQKMANWGDEFKVVFQRQY